MPILDYFWKLTDTNARTGASIRVKHFKSLLDVIRWSRKRNAASFRHVRRLQAVGDAQSHLYTAANISMRDVKALRMAATRNSVDRHIDILDENGAVVGIITAIHLETVSWGDIDNVIPD